MLNADDEFLESIDALVDHPTALPPDPRETSSSVNSVGLNVRLSNHWPSVANPVRRGE